MSLLIPLYKLFGGIEDLSNLITGGYIDIYSFCPRIDSPLFDQVIKCYARALRNEIKLSKDEGTWITKHRTWFNYRHAVNVVTGHICRIKACLDPNIWHEDSMTRLGVIPGSQFIEVWLKPLDYCVWTALAINEAANHSELWIPYNQFQLSWKMVLALLKVKEFNILPRDSNISYYKITEQFELDNGSCELEGIEPLVLGGIWHDIPHATIHIDIKSSDHKEFINAITANDQTERVRTLLKKLRKYFISRTALCSKIDSIGRNEFSFGNLFTLEPYRLVYAAHALCVPDIKLNNYVLGVLPLHDIVAADITFDEIESTENNFSLNPNSRYKISMGTFTQEEHKHSFVTSEYMSLMFISHPIVKWMQEDQLLSFKIDNNKLIVSCDPFDMELCGLLITGSCGQASIKETKKSSSSSSSYDRRDSLLAIANTLIIMINSAPSEYCKYKKYVMLALTYAKMFHGSIMNKIGNILWSYDKTDSYFKKDTLEYRYDIMMKIKQMIKRFNIPQSSIYMFYQWLLIRPIYDLLVFSELPKDDILKAYTEIKYKETGKNPSHHDISISYRELISLLHSKDSKNPWLVIWERILSSDNEDSIIKLILLHQNINIIDSNPISRKSTIYDIRGYHRDVYPFILFDEEVESVISKAVLGPGINKYGMTYNGEYINNNNKSVIFPIPKNHNNMAVIMSNKFCFDAIKIIIDADSIENIELERNSADISIINSESKVEKQQLIHPAPPPPPPPPLSSSTNIQHDISDSQPTADWDPEPEPDPEPITDNNNNNNILDILVPDPSSSSSLLLEQKQDNNNNNNNNDNKRNYLGHEDNDDEIRPSFLSPPRSSLSSSSSSSSSSRSEIKIPNKPKTPILPRPGDNNNDNDDYKRSRKSRSKSRSRSRSQSNSQKRGGNWDVKSVPVSSMPKLSYGTLSSQSSSSSSSSDRKKQNDLLQKMLEANSKKAKEQSQLSSSSSRNKRQRSDSRSPPRSSSSRKSSSSSYSSVEKNNNNNNRSKRHRDESD